MDGFMAYGPDGEMHAFDSADEYAEWVKQQRDLMEAENDRKRHDLDGLLDALDADQLETLSVVISTAVHNGAFGYTVMGRITATKQFKFNVCPTCGKDHDKEFAALAGQDTAIEPNVTEVEARVEVRPGVTEARTFSTFEDAKNAGVPEENRPGFADKMAEYGLIPTWADYVSTKYQCANCGQGYVSLDDRMMKPPGIRGCSNCQQKAKFG